MILFPAIDLKKGRCVRLIRGDFSQATVFNDDPESQARLFAEAGCEWVHIVDLDGARAGRPLNRDAVLSIVRNAKMNTQIGGGIRDMQTIGFWLEAGVTRVILGTAAVTDPDLVREASRQFQGRVAVGIDTKDGKVAIEGWTRSTDTTAITVGRRFEDAGVAALILTDIARDGMMCGANIEQNQAMAEALTVPVIASGGVSSLDDLKAIMAGAPNLAGVVCGRAIYEGKVDPKAAVALLRGAS